MKTTTIQRVLRLLDQNDHDVDQQEQILIDWAQELLDKHSMRMKRAETDIVNDLMEEINPRP